MNRFDVIVVGAGQAGLAMGYDLKRNHRSFCILESNQRVGDSWRKRYDSLVLFTPRVYSQLPGMNASRDPHTYPTKDDIAADLEAYAHRYALPIHFQTTVHSLEKRDGRFILKTNRGTYQANKVVISTGPFQQPWIPPFAEQLYPDIVQMHSSSYRNPNQLQDGNLLIVGAGNSGAQIAVECAKYRQTFLSVSRPLKFMPLQIFGKSIFWYYEKLGLMDAPTTSKKGAWLKKQPEIIYDLHLKTVLKNGDITLKSKAISTTSGHDIAFDDGTRLEVQNIIWATGFQSDYHWIQIPDVLDATGQPKHKRGVSPVDQLYFLGLPWLSCRGSALLGWVGKDAQALMQYL